MEKFHLREPEFADERGSFTVTFYKAGNISQACEKIENLIASEELQQKLYLNGLKTAKERAWENVTDEILEMYGAN